MFVGMASFLASAALCAPSSGKHYDEGIFTREGERWRVKRGKLKKRMISSYLARGTIDITYKDTKQSGRSQGVQLF
jgi:hypothetical protein